MKVGRRGRRVVACVAVLVTGVGGVVVTASPAPGRRPPRRRPTSRRSTRTCSGGFPTPTACATGRARSTAACREAPSPSALVTSNEYRTDVITGVYQQLLGRAPDAGGLAYWRGQIGAGLTFEQFELSLAGVRRVLRQPGQGRGRSGALRRRAVPGRARTRRRRGGARLLRRPPPGRSTRAASPRHSSSAASTSPPSCRATTGTSWVAPPMRAAWTFWVGQLAAGRRDEVLLALIIGSDEYFLVRVAAARHATTTTTTPTTTTTTSTTTPTTPPASPTISLVSSDVSGANVHADGRRVERRPRRDRRRTTGHQADRGPRPDPTGRAVVTVAGLALGAHALQVRGWTVPAGQPGGVASNLVTVGVTVVTPARAVVDLPDDVTGDQVHVMYVLPSDGSDRQLDVNGAITNSIAAWNGWFTAQTGGTRMRLDTFDGVPDVTFVRLPQTDAAVAATGDGRGQIEADLHTLGFNAPGKVYAVYYDGSRRVLRRGRLSAHARRQRGRAQPAGPRSPGQPAGRLRVEPGGCGRRDSRLLRLQHGARGPPHARLRRRVRAAHLGPGSRRRLQPRPDVQPEDHTGRARGSSPPCSTPDHDDYYRHSIPGCLDLARSAFLTPLPAGAQPPPGWTTAGALSVAPDPGPQSGRSVPAPVAPH